MTSKASDKRSVKNVLINRPLQREFTLVIIAIMMTASFFVGVLIRFTLLETTRGIPNTISRSAFEELITQASTQLVTGSILIIFVAVIATGLMGIFFLHRVAGPVYRFGQVLKRIAHGETPNEFQLRPRDFFKETAEEINRVIRVLKKREAATQKIHESLSEISDDKLPSEIRDKVGHIRNAVTHLRRS